MKKYMAPELESLSFGAEESIAGVFPSGAVNNFDFGQDNW